MRNLFIFALKAAASIILLYFAFAQVKLNLIAQQFDHLRDGWLAAAVLILVAQICANAVRWQKIVRQCDAAGRPPFT
ncbi:MAG: hypothetical protein ACREB8_06720, partial [Pseudolabrys sp.]